MRIEAWEELLPIIGDLNIDIFNFGTQRNDPYHHWGPSIKWEYTLQYVTDGEGYYQIENKVYTVKKGDMFYLPKDILIKYWANPDNPYSYHYVGFGGSAVNTILERIGFTPEHPVINFSDDKIFKIFLKMKNALLESSFSSIVACRGYMYELLDVLLKHSPKNNIALYERKNDHVSHAILYIKNHYSNNMTVSSMADAIGLCRNYLSVIFKKQTGMSPMDFLMNYRIEQAKILLKQKKSITEVAMLSGFNSISNFSVQFKRITGKTPLEYKSAK